MGKFDRINVIAALAQHGSGTVASIDKRKATDLCVHHEAAPIVMKTTDLLCSEDYAATAMLTLLTLRDLGVDLDSLSSDI